MELRIKRLHPDAILPVRKKTNDSGLDLAAYLPGGPVTLSPGEQARIFTGIAIELPEGCEAQVRPRSGMTNNGLVVPVGTVDNGYRGDIGVVIFNHSFKYHVIRHGDRIAQLIVCPVAYPSVVEVEALSETERGADGFGSTGVDGDARRIGNHPFIEFTGLMNEYIVMCENALAQGIDFTETSIHGDGKPLPMREHNVPLDVRHVPIDVEQVDANPGSNPADEGV